MTYTEFTEFVELAKTSHKIEKAIIVNQCVSYIQNTHHNCYCKYVQSSIFLLDVLVVALLKCKVTCNFCQFHLDKKLFKIIKLLNYQQIIQIFGFDYICANIDLSEHYVNTTQGLIMNPAEIIAIIKKHQKIKINSGFVTHMLKTLKKTNYSPSTQWFELFRLMISNELHIETHNKIFSSFVYDIIKTGELSKFSQEDLKPLLTSDYLVNFSLREQKTENFQIIIDSCQSIYIHHDLLKRLAYLDYENQKNICKKMINSIDFISHMNRMYSLSPVINLIVKPKELFESVLNENSPEVLQMLLDTYPTHIIYRTELGDVGSDAGGLTKDFYSIVSNEAKKYFIEVDGFLLPNPEKANIKIIRLMGELLARSIFFENITPSLNLHPIVAYFFVHGGNNLNFNNLGNFLKHYDIEYINNLLKILDLSDKDYADFLIMQGEDFIAKPKFIFEYLATKYVNRNLTALVNGFCCVSSNLKYTNFVNPVILHKFIAKNEKYNITGAGLHSLKNNLKITTHGTHYADESDAKIEAENVKRKQEIFKEVFIQILEDLNTNDIEKLKLFFKFWYGTSSVLSFTERKSKVDTLGKNADNAICFESSTCFDKLYISVTGSMYKNKKELRTFLASAISASIENQKLCESAGLYMQFM